MGTSTHRTGSILVALVAAAVIAGCGGDDEDTTTEAPTKAEFVAQANQVCKQGDAELEAVFRQFTSEPSRAEVAEVISETIVPNIQSQIDQIRALTPPAGDEQTITAMLDAAQDALDEEKADPAAVAAAPPSEDPFVDVEKDLHAYGLTECADD